MRQDHGRRARALVGTRFRPQGRDPAAGLDCVGVVLLAYGIATDSVPRDYRLSGDHRAQIERELARHFRPIGSNGSRIGDLMLLEISPNQLHLGIRTDAGFVHADARIGRVVETPAPPQWPILATFRRRRSA